MHIPLFKVYMAESAPEEVSKILMSGYVGQGPKVEKFEADLRQHFELDYLVTVNSCTSALQLAVYLIKPDDGWDKNDEIIVSPLTCFATISSILANGVNIHWADVDPSTCNIDLVDVERKLSARTRAVVVVHWGGVPVDFEQLKLIQEKYQLMYGKKLHIIEDCAHCWSTGKESDIVGRSGNFCCFSFQAIKFLTTGDGGLLILPDSESYRRAKLLRWFGLDRDAGASFRCIQNIEESGFKYHLNDIAAAIGVANLPYIGKNVQIHKDNASFYYEELDSCDRLKLLKRRETNGSYWIFTIIVEERDKFIKHLESHGIAASPVHARCDKHSCVSRYKASLPNMDYLDNHHVSIPCGWWVGPEERQYITDCIKKGW